MCHNDPLLMLFLLVGEILPYLSIAYKLIQAISIRILERGLFEYSALKRVEVNITKNIQILFSHNRCCLWVRYL